MFSLFEISKETPKLDFAINCLILIAVLLVCGLALAIIPYALIWSVNTLFHTGIVFGWDTWGAALILEAFFSLNVTLTRYVLVND